MGLNELSYFSSPASYLVSNSFMIPSKSVMPNPESGDSDESKVRFIFVQLQGLSVT